MCEWLDAELSGCVFKDKRLTDRFKSLVNQMAKGNGKSIPEVCNEWSMTKAAYRFLSNERVDESEILSGHFEQTAKRINATNGPVLVLHDTTEFAYHRRKPEDIGYISRLPINKKWAEELGRDYKSCGILLHASLATTSEGLPLGLTSTKFWTREVFKNTRQLKRHINPTRIPIEQKESIRWLENAEQTNQLIQEPSQIIHIGDRESDIYEYFSSCQDLGNYFIVRSCVNRLANETTIAEEISLQPFSCKHTISYTDNMGELIEAHLDIKIKKLTVHPPIDKQERYTSLPITVISAQEQGAPKNRSPIKWLFLSNLPVTKKADVIQVLDWYKQRWKVEVFFKILKSGLKSDESKLRTADRLTRLIAIYCILAWRIQWLTMMNREAKIFSPKLAFDKIEQKILCAHYKKLPPPKTMQDYINRLARLGGYLSRKSDPPPGNTAIWRGLNKLYELRTGFELANICG